MDDNGTHQRQGKERREMKKEVKRWKKKRIEAQRAKPRTPTPVTDGLIEDEEQTRKKEYITKKETGEQHFGQE